MESGFRPNLSASNHVPGDVAPVVSGGNTDPLAQSLLRDLELGEQSPRPWGAPLLDSSMLAIVGLVIAALALAGSIVCWKRMGKSWRMGIDPGEKGEEQAYEFHPA